MTEMTARKGLSTQVPGGQALSALHPKLAQSPGVAGRLITQANSPAHENEKL